MYIQPYLLKMEYLDLCGVDFDGVLFQVSQLANPPSHRSVRFAPKQNSRTSGLPQTFWHCGCYCANVPGSHSQSPAVTGGQQATSCGTKLRGRAQVNKPKIEAGRSMVTQEQSVKVSGRQKRQTVGCSDLAIQVINVKRLQQSAITATETGVAICNLPPKHWWLIIYIYSSLLIIIHFFHLSLRKCGWKIFSGIIP